MDDTATADEGSGGSHKEAGAVGRKRKVGCMGGSCSRADAEQSMAPLNQLLDRGPFIENILDNEMLSANMYKIRDTSDRQFGNFCLVKELQKNEASVVFSAKRIDWSRRVDQHTLNTSKVAYAVKVEHDNGMTKSALLRETRILSRISHLHVIKMSHAHLFGPPLKRYLYSYMPLFEQDLFTFVSLRGPLLNSPALMHTIMAQVCSGVEALHSADIIHADLKTENILIKNVNKETPFFVVADLGSGYDVRNNDYEEFGHTMCTSSPEVVTNTVPLIGPAADVFSIGCMLCDIAFLKPLFSPRQGPFDHLASVQKLGDMLSFPSKIRKKEEFFTSNGYIYGYSPSRVRLIASWWSHPKYQKGARVKMLNFIKKCCCPDYRLRPELDEVTAFTLNNMLNSRTDASLDEKKQRAIEERPTSFGTGKRFAAESTRKRKKTY